MYRINRNLATTFALLTFALAVAFAPSPTWALGPSQYELTADSGYIEGCYDPCMCPIWWTPSLRGTFQLTVISQEDDGAQFEVTAIDWQFDMGEETTLVTGSGFYLFDGDQHQMVLDLQMNDGPVQQFDSSLIPVPSETPGIFIAVALNGFYCYDHVFDIDAIPAAVVESTSTWGSLKSIFR